MPLLLQIPYIAIGPLGRPEGGIAVTVCDALKSRVRQEYCYTYLAIGSPISPGPLSLFKIESFIF